MADIRHPSRFVVERTGFLFLDSMLYRRKILLALLQALGGRENRRDFQHHLFLFTAAQHEPAYDFVPLKEGCYSLSAEADRQALIKKKLLAPEDDWVSASDTDYLADLRKEDRDALSQHLDTYGPLRGEELVRLICLEHPYYAINSRIAPDVLSSDELSNVDAARISISGVALYTIGYEGKSLERYLNQLIRNDIAVLCDVRGNPFSRKYGFSKRTLKDAVEALGIAYLHLPGLGIASSRRKDVHTREDYEALFDEYEKEVLPGCTSELNTIRSLLANGKRAALTCYELDPAECHRGRVANRLAKDEGWEYALYHI